jgi:hypothetical protein
MTLIKSNSKAAMRLKLFLAVLVLVNIAFWFYGRNIYAQWANVPPPPSQGAAAAVMLGDVQMSYRVWSVLVQNLGEYGGRSKSFDDYRYDYLIAWLDVLSAMDQHSDFAPFLASYYFSNVKDAEKLKSLVLYIQRVSTKPDFEKWKWLAQAITVARFNLKDNDLALEMAHELAGMYEEGMPAWVKQMPAFILNAKGNKQEAFDVMMSILQSEVDTMHPAEIYFTKDYICTRLPDHANKGAVEFCDDL